MLRKMGKALGWSLLGLIVLLGVAVVSPRWAEPLAGPVRTVLVRVVAAAISTSLDGTLQIGTLQGSLLKDPSLSDITLNDVGGETVASIAELRLRYSLRGLPQGQLHIQRVEIVAPKLSLIEEADGRLNLERVLALKPEPTERSFPLLAVKLDKLAITDGHIGLRLPDLPGTRAIEDITLQLRGKIEPQSFRLELQALTARTEPSNVVLKTFQGNVSQTAGAIRFKDWLLETAKSTVTLSGKLRGAKPEATPSPESKLTLALRSLDVAEIGRILGDPSLHGELEGEITVAQSDDALGIRGRLAAAEGTLELDAKISPQRQPTQYHGTLTVRHLDLSALVDKPGFASDINLRLRALGEGLVPAHRSGRLQLAMERSHIGEITIEPSEIRLQVYGERFEIQTFDLNTSVLAADLEGEIDLADRSHLTYALSLAPADLRTLVAAETLGGHMALTGELKGEWPELTTSGVLTGENLTYGDARLETFELAYEATDLGADPQANARLQAGKITLGAYSIEELSAQSTYAWDNATHQLQFGAKTDESSQLYANITGTVTANDERQTIAISRFEARLEDHSWQATTPLQATRSAENVWIQPFRLAHDRESIEAVGALVGNRLENVRLRVKELDLDFLQRVFSLPRVVAGRADWQAELEGDLSAPSLTSTLMLLSNGAKTLPFERVNAAVRYAQGRLDTALSILQQGRQTAALQADLPIDLGLMEKPVERRLLDEPLQIDLKIDRPDMAALSQALPELPQISGTLGGKLAISGKYDRLTIDSNAELQQLGIAGAASQLNGSLRFAANVVTAPSVSALREAIARDEMTVKVPELTFRVPSLTGQLPGAESTPVSLREVSAEISATWERDALTSASTDLEIHAEANAFPPIHFASKVRLESEQIALTRATLSTPASELSGAGKLDLRDRSVLFSLNIPRLQLGEFKGLLPPDLPSDVAGRVELAGTLETPQLNARLRYAGARINLDASARLQEQNQPYRARVQISSFDVAQLDPEMSGELWAMLDVQGRGLTEATPEARISMDLESTGFTLAPGLGAQVRSRVSGSTVSVDLFDVTSELLTLSARGTVSTTQPTDLRYRLVVRDLAALEEWLGVALEAKGELKGSVTGHLNALRAQSQLELNDWRYGPWRGNRLRASVHGRTLATAPAVTLQANVTDLEGPQVSPSSLRLEGRFANETGTFALETTEGPFSHSKVAGTLDTTPYLQLRIDPFRLQSEQWSWNNVKPVEIAYDAQQVLTIHNLELKNAAQQISAHGKYSPQGAIEGNVRVQALQIKPAVSAFAPAALIPDGQLSLNLKVNGTVDEPQLDGTLQATRLQWSEQPVGDVRAQVASRGSTFRGSAKWVDHGDVLLSVSGKLDRGPAKSLALDVDAPNFDLARLESFSPAIRQSAGQLRIDLEVRGTLDQPSANGTLELRNGQLLHSAIGEPYTNMQTLVVFRGNRLDIKRLEVGSSTGTARLTGWLETDGLALDRANLTLDANEFTAVKTQAVEAVVSSNVAVRGSQEKLAALGSITVSRARIRYENLPATGPAEVQPWELTVEGVYGPGPEAATFGAAEATASAGAETDPLAFLRTDIRLDMPRNVWIQGKGTAIELSGNLQLKKDLGVPFALAGDVETLRGFATFLNRKFTIEKGIVTFTGSEDINPILDISASYEVADYTVYVIVTGESKKPEISYSSEPELDQQDILSLLIFGKTSDRLTSSEQTTLGSKAEQFAGGLAAGMLERTVGKALGLDTVAIELGDQGSASSVGAGRYLTQDIYVEYERKFRDPRQGSRTGNAVTVEYSINRDLKLEATGSDYGETAIDFVWSHDY